VRPAPTLLSSLAELVLPRSCVGCGHAGSIWCRGCLEFEFDPALHRPDPCPDGLPPVAAAAPYAGCVRSAILAAKERDRRELDRPLAGMLAVATAVLITAQKGRPSLAGPLWLVPVPASPTAARARGRDHVGDWTRQTVHWLRAAGIEAYRRPALRRVSGGLDSVGLDAGQRALNLSGAFVLAASRAPPRATTVIIVDDIVTTGATLVAASACLSNGLDLCPSRLHAAVVAATQRRRAS